jgi:hypothetical protein
MEEEKKPFLLNLPYSKDLWEDREQIAKDCAKIKEEMLKNLLAAQRGQRGVDFAKSNHKAFFTPEAVKAMQEAWLERCKPIFRNFLMAKAILDLHHWLNSVPGLKPTLDAASKSVTYEKQAAVHQPDNFIFE